MDFGALPPEVNSARIYAGPGSGPMLAAASAWDVLAAELGSAASTYSSVVTSLAEGSWLGPASTSMAAAATPYVDWMSTTGTQAEETGYQARAAAAAYEAAFAMTVPPAEVAANRAQLAALVATNVLGQNTPAIAATEALYGEMWAQDAAAMYGYAGSSAAAATVTPFSTPPETTNAAGAASQGGTVAQAAGTSSSAGVQSTLSQVVSSLPNALQSMAAPTAGVNPFAPGSNTATTGIAGFLNLLSGQSGSAVGGLLNSAMGNGFLSGNWVNPASISPAVTSAFGDIGFLAIAGQSFGGLNPALLNGARRAVGDRRSEPRRFGRRLTRISTEPGRIGGIGRCGPRDPGRGDVGAAELGRGHARDRLPSRGSVGRLGLRPGRRGRWDRRDAGGTGHACDADGRLRWSRLRLCRAPLRVPSHRRRASAGCRITEGAATP